MPDHARRTLGPGTRLGFLSQLRALGLVGILLTMSAQAAQVADKASAVSDAIEQVAMLDLRMQSNPLPRDYQITVQALSLAAALDPEDLELQHKLVAAAWATTDDRLLLSATRRLVELDPSDTVAQLRLISAVVGRAQTGEDRLAAYERYLGPAGRSIDPSVRSRLAFDAASLARELGDEGRFVELLSMATSLDMTNKLAATLAMTYHAERRDDPLERLEMLVNLLYSDPLDSNIHQAIAHLLASEGAFEQARRYFQNAALIHQHAGDSNLSLLQQGLIFQWHHEGPESVVKTLNNMIARRRQAIAENRAMAEAAEMSLAEMPLPEDDRLDPAIDRIRALAAAAAGDDISRDAALNDMSLQITEQVRQLTSFLVGNDDELKRQAMIQMAQLFGELHFAGVLANSNVEASARAVQVFQSQAPDLNRMIRWLIPWITMRLGDLEAAAGVTEFLETGVGEDLFNAEMALALGERKEAARGFLGVMQETPISPLGAWAHSRLASIVETDDLRTSDGRRLDAFARSVPNVIDKMIRGPTEFMNIRFEPVSRTLATEEHARVAIRVQNTSTIPLSVGPGSPISSRFLIQPHIDTEIGTFDGQPQPEVIELDRRLRLMPLESMEFVLPCDSPFTRWLLGLNADSTMRQSWRLLQGFRAAREKGAMTKGPLCHSAETQPRVIRTLAASFDLSDEEIARRIRTVPDDQLHRTLVGARSIMMRRAPENWDADAPTTIDEVVQALIERYDRSGQLDRALMLAVLPHAKMIPALEPLDDRARRLVGADIRSGDAIDQLIGCLVLLTRTSSEADQLILDAIESGAPPLSDIATLLRLRYSTGGVGYAKGGRDPNTLAGPTLSLLREQAARAAAASAAAAESPEMPPDPLETPDEGG